jgi:hypothetical protein
MQPKKSLNSLTPQDLLAMPDGELMNVKNSLHKLMKNEEEILRNKIQVYQSKIPNLQAGNLDDVSKIIWPFIFTAKILDQDNLNSVTPLTPGNSSSGFISISQEASFVATKMVKTVFEKVDIGGGLFTYNYIDPNDFDAGLATNLSFVINDSQSTRTFHQIPMDLDHLGHGQEPNKFKTNLFFSENNNVEVKFFNNHASKTYVPFLSMFGYRVRVQDAQEIFSLVTSDK